MTLRSPDHAPDCAPQHGRPTTVRIDASCTACGNCIITCGPRALRPAPGRPAVIDDSCTACGECIEVCPVGAITEIRLGSWQ
jgi:NAD-dependent dihydropyrimidine dehydrogenase PreA subunit